jgi:hypothetical protein
MCRASLFLPSASFCYRLLSAIGFFLLSASFCFLKMVSSLFGDSNWFELVLLFPWISFYDLGL